MVFISATSVYWKLDISLSSKSTRETSDRAKNTTSSTEDCRHFHHYGNITCYILRFTLSLPLSFEYMCQKWTIFSDVDLILIFGQIHPEKHMPKHLYTAFIITICCEPKWQENMFKPEITIVFLNSLTSPILLEHLTYFMISVVNSVVTWKWQCEFV